MAFLTKRLDVSSALIATNTSIQRDLLENWDQSSGVMNSGLLKFHKHLVLFGPVFGDCMPDITYLGKKSLAKSLMGEGWRKDFSQHSGKEHVASAYIDAENGEPILEYVSFIDKEGRSMLDFSYERLILPFKTSKGCPQTLTYSALVRLNSAHDHQPSPINRRNLYLPSNSPVVLGKDENANLSHLGSGL